MGISDDEAVEWLFELCLRRDIFTEYSEPVLELVKLCKTREEFELLKHTMEHLIILNSSQHSTLLLKMAGYIKGHIPKDGTLAIVAMAWGEEPDSSQRLLQMIKPWFKKRDRVEFFNTVNSYEKKKNIEKYPTFMLVDDFAGTGKTVKQRYEFIVKSAAQKNVACSASVCLLFGMDEAENFLKKHKIDAHFFGTLKAGISGHFSGQELVNKKALMQRLEQELAANIEGEPLPSLGYGGAEALFCIEKENAPNSNFPIFWWPECADGEERNTIMQRYET